MKYGKFFGWGIVIYAIMYLLVALLSSYGWYPSVVARCVALLGLLVVASIAGRNLNLATARDVLPYSLFWMLEVAFLDGLFGFQYAGWQMYMNWSMWIGYSLVALVPLFSVLPRRKNTVHTVI